MNIIRWACAIACALSLAVPASAGPVSATAGFTPQTALAYGAVGDDAVGVDAANPLPIRGSSAVVAGSFTRPADTTAYAAGDLVANSTTAGSVTPVALAVARTNGGTGQLLNIRLSKSGTSLNNASFRVHLFRTSPTTTVGDNGVFAGAVNGIAAVYIGYVDITTDVAFSDGAKGSATAPAGRQVMIFETGASSSSIYALVEARGAYTPTSGETFTVAAEVLRD